MGWMRFLAFTFNLIGGVLLAVAIGAFLLGAAIGSTGGSNTSDGAMLGAMMGGMVGTLAALGNFLASLGMFFCGAVLWALRGLLEEARLRRPGV